MTEEPQTQPDRMWKLGLAIVFLAFSLWLSLAPLWDGVFDGDRAERGEREPVAQGYGGFVSQTDLLRRYASFTGEGSQLPDPFAWFEPKPDPGPGGIAPVAVETGLPADVVETKVSAEQEEPIPQIQVRLILRARASSRALVDGRVLGVGDMTKAGKIVEILDSGIHTMYRGKKLFFALSHR